MKVVRSVAGLLLVVLAVAAIIYWESTGREQVMTEHVLAAACTIDEGTVLEEKMLKPIKVLKENVLKNTLKPGDEKKLIGKIAGGKICENQQISTSHMKKEVFIMEKGFAPYTIKKEWIDNISSSVRKGDRIEIYSRDGTFFLGAYKVAFVKDSSNGEIVDPVQPYSAKDILERTDSSAVLDHLEIQASLEEYQAISSYVAETGDGLLIVQQQ